MNKIKRNGSANPTRTRPLSRAAMAALLLGAAVVAVPDMTLAQSYRFNAVQVDGNARIETGTVLSYAGIARGQSVSAAQLNDAYQRLVASGLFETVEITPRGGTLVINVQEYPTVNRVRFEGNRRLKDDALSQIVSAQPRLVFSPTRAQEDAEKIAEAYAQQGRISARVTPKVIRRSDNRVDLVYEIFEGQNTEVNRVGFVGNRVYSDRRLRRVLDTKQAGLLRQLIRRDTFVEDRLEFDQQLLRDFYLSRGYIDFRTTAVNAELARGRDAYFVTFNVQEGQQFKFGSISVVSDYPQADADLYGGVVRIREGSVYSPTDVENAIVRMESLAVREGLDFLRVEPRVTRNERDLTLDVEFVLTRGPRIFVERIDVEGNTTTLDRVIRQQFKIVEGDPFNPRQIRQAAERIRALGFFEDAKVNAREGSGPDQVVVDVDVQEQATGSLAFGGTYSTNGGFGLAVSFSERNFLGRGQTLSLTVSGADDNKNYGLSFTEPAFLGRDVAFDFDLSYVETESYNATYDTEVGNFGLGLTFPLGEQSRFGVRYQLESSAMTESSGVTTGSIIGDATTGEIGQGHVVSSSLGYVYSFDTRTSGIDPNKGFLLEFSQDFAGLGGDTQFIRTKARAVAQTRILNEEVTLRATLRGGMLNYTQGSSRTIDRVGLLGEYIRGFTPDGFGPRQRDTGGTYNDALGGNMFVVGSFEAEFPLGLPEEYGISGGAFYDISNVWDVGASGAGASDLLYDAGSFRHVVGVSLFWDTPIGPLRFNFAKALRKETYDEEQLFNLTIRSEF